MKEPRSCGAFVTDSMRDCRTQFPPPPPDRGHPSARSKGWLSTFFCSGILARWWRCSTQCQKIALYTRRDKCPYPLGLEAHEPNRSRIARVPFQGPDPALGHHHMRNCCPRQTSAELSDAGGPVRQNWQARWPARFRSSDFVRLFTHLLLGIVPNHRPDFQ